MFLWTMATNEVVICKYINNFKILPPRVLNMFNYKECFSCTILIIITFIKMFFVLVSSVFF